MLICALGYWYAFRQQSKEKYNQALLLLMLGGLAVRIYCSMDTYLHPWDERYHALVAKNLLHHWLKPTLHDDPILPYNITAWSSNHIWLHKQPLSLWLIVLSLKTFGISAFAVRIPSIVLSTIAIKLVYDIALPFYGRTVAFFSAFLLSTNGLIIELASGRAATDHPDIAFFFFVLLGVWMAIRWHKQQKIITLIWIGIVTGVAVLCKWLSGLVVVPVWIAMCLPYIRQEPKRYAAYLLMMLATIAIVVLPWQWYILHHYPAEAKWEYYYNTLHLYKGLESHEGDIFYHADKIRQIYGEAVYLPILWFTYVVIKNKEVGSYWVLAWFWLVFLFFSIAATKMRAYTVIASPAIFIMIARFAKVMWEQAKAMKRGKVWLRIVVITVIALPVRYAIERAKFSYNTDRNPKWVKELQALNDGHIHKGVLFNYDAPMEAMFVTKLAAYTELPDKAKLEELTGNGYTVLINDKWNVPEEVRNMKGVEMMRMSVE